MAKKKVKKSNRQVKVDSSFRPYSKEMQAKRHAQ